MALTFTKTKEGVFGDLRYWAGTITFDSSYPTNGEAVAAADFSFGNQLVDLRIGSAFGVLCEWIASTGKIKVWFPTGGNGTAPTTLAAPAGALASGASAINAPGLSATVAITPGIAKEAGSTCDLSTVVISVLALGL